MFGINDHDLGGDPQTRWNTLSGDNRLIMDTAMESYDAHQSALNGNVIKYPDGRAWVKSWSLARRRISMAFLDRPCSTDQVVREDLLNMVPIDTNVLIIGTSVPPLVTPFLDRLVQIHRKGEISEASIFSFLEVIRGWIEAKPSRQVIVVSGGALFGATGYIRHKKWDPSDRRFRFAITSPVTDQPAAGAFLNRQVFKFEGVSTGRVLIRI